MTGRMIKSLVVVLFLAAASPAASKDSITPPTPVPATPEDAFNNILVQSGDLYIAGQPTPEGLAWLKARGVTTIINVRTPFEMDNRDIVPFDEAQAALDLQMTYVHVPMGGDDHPYSPEALDEVAAALAAADGPVVLHCTVGWRASHVWAAYLVKHRGLDPNTAVSLARDAYMTEQPFESLLGGDLRYEETIR